MPMDSVTSDILPTLCELTGQSLPDRPLDGISLVSAMDGDGGERPDPICFWSFGGEVADDAEPYIDPDLQSGTCPLAKLMDGKFTRDFENYHHPEITEADFEGPRAILDARYKLVVDGEPGSGRELFDIRRMHPKKVTFQRLNRRKLNDWGQIEGMATVRAGEPDRRRLRLSIQFAAFRSADQQRRSIGWPTPAGIHHGVLPGGLCDGFDGADCAVRLCRSLLN